MEDCSGLKRAYGGKQMQRGTRFSRSVVLKEKKRKYVRTDALKANFKFLKNKHFWGKQYITR